MDLTLFFHEQGIDVFSEVSIDTLSDKDRSFVVQFFPGARFVIVFGKEVPVPAYLMPPKEKTREMLRIAGRNSRRARIPRQEYRSPLSTVRPPVDVEWCRDRKPCR